jgi:hypothetical protein
MSRRPPRVPGTFSAPPDVRLVYHGPCPGCRQTLRLGQSLHCTGDALRATCPFCLEELDIALGSDGAVVELAGPTCEVCDLNWLLTEGPLCARCSRCEECCDGAEYPEGFEEAHVFKPAA